MFFQPWNEILKYYNFPRFLITPKNPVKWEGVEEPEKPVRSQPSTHRPNKARSLVNLHSIFGILQTCEMSLSACLSETCFHICFLIMHKKIVGFKGSHPAFVWNSYQPTLPCFKQLIDNRHIQWHPVLRTHRYTTASLLRPYPFNPNVKITESFHYFEHLVKATTYLLRRGFFGKRWSHLRAFDVSHSLWRPKSSLTNLSLEQNGRSFVGQQIPTLLDVTICVRLHTMLHVFACCWDLLRKVWNQSNFWANNSQHFFCSLFSEA